MNLRESVRIAPSVLVVGYAVFVVGLFVGMLGVPLSRPELLLATAIGATVLGSLLLFDVKGAAEGLVDFSRNYRPFGSSSGPVMPGPGFARFFGLLMLVVAVGFAVAVLQGDA